MKKLQRKLRIMLPTIAALLCLLLSSGLAEAVMLTMNLEELSTEADSIIIGTVQKVSSQWNEAGTNIYTTVTVHIEDQLKAESGDQQVTVIVHGGEVGGITEYVSDTPLFRTGEEVLLFLTEIPQNPYQPKQSATADYTLQGNFQGKLEIDEETVEGLPLDILKNQIYAFIEGESIENSVELNWDDQELTSYNQFVPLGFRWPNASIPVDYRINASVARNSEIRAAANTWSNAGANFSMRYLGTHSRSGGAFKNNINEIMWNDLGSNYALAVATIWTVGSTILEADMTFNTRYAWSIDGWNYHDVQTVALHEFGHWVGLNHSPRYESIMYYRIKGTQRYLHSSDVAGVRYIYGTTSANIINDNFANRLTISGVSGQTTGNNITATKEPGEPNHAGNSGGQSVWWEWVAPASGVVQIDTFGSDFDTLLAVYTGTTVSTLNLVAANDDVALSRQSLVTFSAQAGTSYKIAIDGWLNSAGNIVLNWLLSNPVCTVNPPLRPVGPSEGLTGVNYTFTTETGQCSNNHALEYRFRWGGDLYSGWSSNNEATTSWATAGTYAVTVQARCSTNNSIISTSSPARSVVITAPRYDLTINQQGSGSTTPSAGSYQFESGEELTITAEPDQGRLFSNWQVGTETIVANPLIITLTDHLSVTAVFIEEEENEHEQHNNGDPGEEETEQTYDLTISVEGNGITTPLPDVHPYPADEIVDLTADPAEGWQFVHWLIEKAIITTDSAEVTITGDLAVKAVFQKITPPPQQDNGSGNGDSGDNISTPPPVYSPPAPPGPPPAEPNPPASETPAAIQYTLTMALEGQGTIDPAPGTHRYDQDYQMTLTAKGDQGWRFDHWVVDGRRESQSTLNLLLTKDISAHAYFKAIEKGDITGSGKVNVTDVTLVARYTMGLITLTSEQIANADVNGDGVVNVLDIVLLMRYSLGLIDSFPIQ